MKMNEKKQFFLFLIGKDKFAIPLLNFVVVKDITSIDDKSSINYNDKKIKLVDLHEVLNLKPKSFEIALIVNYEDTYFAILADELLDAVQVDQNQIKTTRDLYNIEPPLITKILLLQSKEIVKVLDLKSIVDTFFSS